MTDEQELVVEQIQIGPMQNFTYVVGSRSTREVAIVDPAWDIEDLVKHVNDKGYTITAALVTHYHPDHIGGSLGGHSVDGIAELLAINPLKIYTHKQEADGVKKVTSVSESDLVRVDSGDDLRIGDVTIEFLHTPGHTPGSQCFRIKNTLVSGDTLFINGCGRVDLPGSDSDEMYRSIQKLAALPDDTLLLPGHNYAQVPSATLGETKQQNAYMNIKDIETWRTIMS
jgi:hydroxyacylglutathione hydrolase